MLRYHEAERLVKIFTDIEGVTTEVHAKYELSGDIGFNKMPDRPYVESITISYYAGCVPYELREILAELEILSSPNRIDSDKMEVYLSINLEDADTEERFDALKKRIKLVSDIADRLETVADYEWYYAG